MLADRLTADMKESMKARDTLRTSVLRMTLSEVKNARIEKGADLTDDDVLQVVKRAVKKREEAAEAFGQGGRPELAQTEEKEAEILRAYLPQLLDAVALEAAVDAAIAASGATSVKQMGVVMKLVMAEHGARVDGKAVQALVRAKLGE